MKLEVLVATMNQIDYSLLEKMNIQTDAIISNQNDVFIRDEFLYKGNKIKWFSFDERGVGLNRNNALMRATGDIVLFSDDDVEYMDGYETTILNFYDRHPDADVVIFNMNLKKNNGEIKETVNTNACVGRYQVTGYGAPCISVRLKRIRFNNIFFHLDFGGGAKYSCGEDTLFLQDCAKKGLKIYTTTDKIGHINQGESSWFIGYNKKYFIDKGILFYLLDKKLCKYFALYHCLKHRKLYKEYGWKESFRLMLRGIKQAAK